MRGAKTVVSLKSHDGQDMNPMVLGFSRKQWSAFLEVVPFCAFIRQKDVIVLANRLACQLVGLGPGELEGRSIGEFIVPDEWQTLESTVRMGTPASRRHHLRTWRRVDGTTVQSEVVASTIVFDGKPSVLVFTWDLSDNARLLDAVQTANRMELLAILTRSIIHDFNNILSVVSGGLSLIRINLRDPDLIMRTVSVIQQATDRASSLVGQLMSLVRGREFEPEPIDLKKLLEQSCQAGCLASRTEYEITVADDVHPLAGDYSLLMQVFSNLVLNASQAMSNGGKVIVRARNVRISSRTKHWLAPGAVGHFVAIDVSDKGPGIPRELQTRIFDPFFTTKPDGTGLGLTSAHFIVTRHGGFITVESDVGSGTTFTVFLPSSPVVVGSNPRGEED